MKTKTVTRSSNTTNRRPYSDNSVTTRLLRSRAGSTMRWKARYGGLWNSPPYRGELLNVSEAGPASKRIIAGYGFSIFLLSDIVMFSPLFASYAVLAKASAGGPTGAQLFDQHYAAMETAFLLLSSYRRRTRNDHLLVQCHQ